MAHLLRKTALLGAGVALAGAVTWAALRPRILAWGTTEEEATRPLPGDELLPQVIYETTRAITVLAPAAAVWPWLVQLGQNRGGFYSYDALENLAGLDIHSADTVHPEWQDLRVGEDYMTLDPKGDMKLTIVVLEPERAFVVRTGGPEGPPQPPGDVFKGEIEATWGFHVQPIDDRAARLIIRWRANWVDTAPARLAKVLMLEPVHFLMEERMLRGIRDRAERLAAQG